MAGWSLIISHIRLSDYGGDIFTQIPSRKGMKKAIDRGEVKVNGVCVDDTVDECPSGQVLVDGECEEEIRCVPGFHEEDGACVEDIPEACEVGYHREDGVCVENAPEYTGRELVPDECDSICADTGMSADLDDDGDMDLMVTDYYGEYTYYENLINSNNLDELSSKIGVFPNPAMDEIQSRDNTQNLRCR